MTNSNIDLVNRLIAIAEKAEDAFDAYTRKISSEIVRARFQDDASREAMLEASLKHAKTEIGKVRTAFKNVLLSNEVVDSLEAALGEKTEAVKKLLKDMEDFGATLDRIAQVAQIITSVLKIVKNILT